MLRDTENASAAISRRVIHFVMCQFWLETTNAPLMLVANDDMIKGKSDDIRQNARVPTNTEFSDERSNHLFPYTLAGYGK